MTLEEGIQSVLEHLETCLNDRTPLDTGLVGGFSRSLYRDRLFPDGKNGSIESNELLNKFVPVINQLLYDKNYSSIDPEGVIIELLEMILSFLTFADVLQIYSEKFIEDAIESKSPAVVQLALKIFKLNVGDISLNDYFKKTGLLVKLISKLLSEPDLPLAEVNEIEHLVNILIDRMDPIVESVILQEECMSIYLAARNSNNATLIMRLLDLSVGLLYFTAKSISSKKLPSRIYAFTKDEFINNDDTLFVIFLFSYYATLVSKIDTCGNVASIINDIEEPIDCIAYLFSIRESDEIIKSFYSHEIVGLFKAMSYSNNLRIQEYLKFLISKYEFFKSHNLFPNHFDSDLRLLCIINPDLFSEEFYSEIIQKLPVYNQKYFSILLNIVQSKVIFDLLVKDERISNSAISSLSTDKVYLLILQLTKKTHSTLYLINELPNIISDYLIDSSNEIYNSEVYSLRLNILENLLFNENLDLSLWREGLTSSYELMKNGRKIGNIEPQVDVLDEFL